MKKNKNICIKQKYVLLFMVAIVLLSSSSCKSIFSESMYRKLTETSVKKVQFYVSKEIILKRELNSSEVAVAKGEIKFQDGKYYEYVTILKGVPGVCVNSNSHFNRFEAINSTDNSGISMDLSFDNTGRTLMFINGDCLKPYHAPDGSSPFGVFFDTEPGYHRVKFGNKDYDIVKGSYYSHLLVKKERKQNFSKTEEVIKGRKLE